MAKGSPSGTLAGSSPVASVWMMGLFISNSILLLTYSLSHTTTEVLWVLSAASATVYFPGNLNILTQQCGIASQLQLSLKIHKPHQLEHGATKKGRGGA